MKPLVLTLGMMVLLRAAPAASVELVSGSVDGGGGLSAGDALIVQGTVGQPDAGVCTGGTIELQGGLWWGGELATAVPGPDLPRTPRVFRLHNAAPNPFNPMTTIQFEVPRESRVRMEVVDIRGRIVASLKDETMPAGLHDVSWNGRDQRGTGVSSGIYFVRMRAEGFGAVRKVSLVK